MNLDRDGPRVRSTQQAIPNCCVRLPLPYARLTQRSVVTGAPSPTGAGAFRLDRVWNDDRYYLGGERWRGELCHCLGIHYNRASSRRATSGDPRVPDVLLPVDDAARAEHLQQFAAALCFSELGYLSADGWRTARWLRMGRERAFRNRRMAGGRCNRGEAEMLI